MIRICGCTGCWAEAHEELYSIEHDQYFCREHWSEFVSAQKTKEKEESSLAPADDFEFFQMIEIFRK